MTQYMLFFGATVNYAVAIFSLWQTLRRLANWTHAQGKVESLRWHSVDAADYARFPVVRFRVKGGREYSFTHRVSVTAYYSPGMQVDVLYDPNNPDCAVINDWPAMWGLVIIGFVVGSVFSIFTWIAW
jgi:hypothetical protein